jgi:peptide/nickel transport system permease protein
LTVGLLAAVSAVGIGTILGLLAGFSGGWFDALVMRLVDAVLSFPSLVVLLLLVSVLGPSIGTVVLVIALFEWPVACRIVRQVSLSVKEHEYIRSAKSIGSSNLQTIRRHMLLPVMAPLTVVATVISASAILLEAALSFLGLGVREPQATWGGMLQSSYVSVRQAPYYGFFPGMCISLVALAYTLIGKPARKMMSPVFLWML